MKEWVHHTALCSGLNSPCSCSNRTSHLCSISVADFQTNSTPCHKARSLYPQWPSLCSSPAFSWRTRRLRKLLSAWAWCQRCFCSRSCHHTALWYCTKNYIFARRIMEQALPFAGNISTSCQAVTSSSRVLDRIAPCMPQHLCLSGIPFDWWFHICGIMRTHELVGTQSSSDIAGLWPFCSPMPAAWLIQVYLSRAWEWPREEPTPASPSWPSSDTASSSFDSCFPAHGLTIDVFHGLSAAENGPIWTGGLPYTMRGTSSGNDKDLAQSCPRLRLWTSPARCSQNSGRSSTMLRTVAHMSHPWSRFPFSRCCFWSMRSLSRLKSLISISSFYFKFENTGCYYN